MLSRFHTWLTDLSLRSGRALLEASLPATCAGCGRAGNWICERCVALISVETGPGCQRCGRKGWRRRSCSRCEDLFPTRLTHTRAGFQYQGPLRRAIQRFKYNGEYQRGFDLGQRLADRVLSLKLLNSSSFDVIVPVPLHPRRVNARGFNQSEILAQSVSEAVSIPVCGFLRRVRNTTPQVRLSAHLRLGNLNEAFVVSDEHEADIRGKSIIIIDDVMTTGATLAACALPLQRAGARRLVGLTLAREQ